MAGLLAVAGCGPTAEPDAPARSAAEAGNAAPSRPAASQPQLLIDGSGLVMRDSAGARRTVAFGAPASIALAAARQVYGEPRKVEKLEECGAGPLEVSRFSGLTLAVQDGKFAGWSVDDRYDPPLPATPSGIGIGSTRAELEAAYSVDEFESSLGDEFTADGIAGLIGGPGENGESGKITHLWAGATCIMR